MIVWTERPRRSSIRLNCCGVMPIAAIVPTDAALQKRKPTVSDGREDCGHHAGPGLVLNSGLGLVLSPGLGPIATRGTENCTEAAEMMGLPVPGDIRELPVHCL